MIHLVEGDILLTTAKVIGHGIAPNDHFQSGLASQLRERHPSLAKDFRHHAHVHHPKSGDLWVWAGNTSEGAVQIACLLTQEGDIAHGSKPGRAHLEHVNHALKNLRKWMDQEKVTSIALPRLATGVGTLKWDDVLALIRQHLGDTDSQVFLYHVYKSDVKANER